MIMRLISAILRPLMIPASVSSTWRLKLSSMTSLRATRKMKSSLTRSLPSTRTGLRFSGTAKTAERSVIIAKAQLPDMDPVTIRLLALNNSTQVSNRVAILLQLPQLHRLLHRILVIKVMEAMVSSNPLSTSQQPAHQQRLRVMLLLLQLLRLPLKAIVTPMVQLVMAKLPPLPLSKAMDTTSNRLTANSNNSSINPGRLILATAINTVVMVKDPSTRSSVLKVMAVVGIAAANTEQVKCYLSKT